MALAMRSPVISSLPNAVLKYGLYPAIFEILSPSACGMSVMPISIGLPIGPSA